MYSVQPRLPVSPAARDTVGGMAAVWCAQPHLHVQATPAQQARQAFVVLCIVAQPGEDDNAALCTALGCLSSSRGYEALPPMALRRRTACRAACSRGLQSRSTHDNNTEASLLLSRTCAGRPRGVGDCQHLRDHLQACCGRQNDA